MNAELKAFADRLDSLLRPEELFGAVKDASGLKKLYRQFARVAHADRYILPADKALAHEAFTRLTALFHEAEERLKSGKYGTTQPTKPATIHTKLHTYTISTAMAAGDLAVLYRATTEDGTDVLIKMARDRRDNDLLERESTVLATLQKEATAYSFRHYLPELVESFVTTSKAARRVNVLKYVPRYVPLTAVVSKYPDGIDPKHFTWIWSRLLDILGFVQMQGVVHGAVLPPHILINPDTHGLMLVDWAFSIDSQSLEHPKTYKRLPAIIRAISEPYRDWYAPEVLKKRPATAATDVYMAARTMLWLLSGRKGTMPSTVPAPYRRFLESCLLRAQARRPDDAWALAQEFKNVSTTVFGRRRFVRLELA